MLTVSQLSKSFASRALFDDVSLQVNRGDRIGLVGPNGAGKSTLFALLLGDVSPEKGTIAIEKNATIGFLPQETAAAGNETVLELACSKVAHASSLRAEEKRKLEACATFDEHGGWELEPKAKRVLAGLAFRETDFDRPARALSGGWIMRAHLARLLVMQPDLLLLDEPTNHLDLESLQWFQEYLRTYPGGVACAGSRCKMSIMLMATCLFIADWNIRPSAANAPCLSARMARENRLFSSCSQAFCPCSMGCASSDIMCAQVISRRTEST